MAAAGPGEVLASGTVRDLTAGAGWKFDDRGLVELKGLAEPIHAYALDLRIVPAIGLQGDAGPGIRGVRGLGAVAAVLLVAFVIVFGGIQFVGGSAQHATAAESPPGLASAQSVLPTSASESPAASPSVDAMPLPAAGTHLSPGTFVVTQMTGTPTLTVTDPGWVVKDTILYLVRATSSDDKVVLRVVNALATDPCDNTAGVPVNGSAEEQFVAWARANNGLRLGTSAQRTYGSVPTTEYDATVVDKHACALTTPVTLEVAHAPFNDGRLFLISGQQAKLAEGTVGQDLLLILIEAPPADFAAFEPEAENLLDTLTFAQ